MTRFLKIILAGIGGIILFWLVFWSIALMVALAQGPHQ